MNLGRPLPPLQLDVEQRQQLEALASSRSLRPTLLLDGNARFNNWKKSSDYVSVFPGHNTSNNR